MPARLHTLDLSCNDPPGKLHPASPDLDGNPRQLSCALDLVQAVGVQDLKSGREGMLRS